MLRRRETLGSLFELKKQTSLKIMNKSSNVLTKQPDYINEALLASDMRPELVLAHYAAWLRLQVRFEGQCALESLPEEPGLILIRGPRQYGKSTWLECQLVETLKSYGPGSALYLNADLIDSHATLRTEIQRVVDLFSPDAATKRLFIDEISAVDDWEKAIKYLVDSGPLRDVLVVTTGSRASDLRRSAERLPGRKGRLPRTSFLFLPIAFGELLKHVPPGFSAEQVLWTYMLSGGSPVACSELLANKELPEYVLAMTRDWVLGEFARRGRSRQFILNILDVLLATGGSVVGFTKLARDTGLANNTAAQEYIELLSDLLCVAPCFQWHATQRHILQRKACKFHFTNLLVANAFRKSPIYTLEQLASIQAVDKGRWYEWLVAQEIWRRQAMTGSLIPESLKFWTDGKDEVDFVLDADTWLEVKAGQASPHEFSFLQNVRKETQLWVVATNKLHTKNAQSISIRNFLSGDSVKWEVGL